MKIVTGLKSTSKAMRNCFQMQIPLRAGQAEPALCPHVVMLRLSLLEVSSALEQQVWLWLLVDGRQAVVTGRLVAKLRTPQGQH